MKNITYIIVTLILISLTSCEELFTTIKEIDIPEHDRKLSINTVLSGDSIITFISHSKEIDDENPYDSIDATVSLLEDGEEILTFEYNNKNNPSLIIEKKLNDSIKEGLEYTLIVESQKFGTAKSSEVLPKSSKVESLNFSDAVFQGEFGERYNKFEFVLDDTRGVDNYYVIKFSYAGIRDGRYIYANTNDPQIKSIYIGDDLLSGYYGSRSFLVSDKVFDGEKRKLSFEISKPYDGGGTNHKYKIFMQIRNVTKGYYNYLISREQADEAEYNPFAEPVAVVGNIENGYGVFNIFTSKKYVIFEN